MHQEFTSSYRFDHLVIAAENLQQGIDWFHRKSGVTIPVGGEHELMGTHNCLTAMSNSQYAEIIAINPQHSAIDRVRCYALDDPGQKRQLKLSPKLVTWVAATTNIQAAVEALAEIDIDLGVPVTMSRGEFHWQLSVRNDGSLPLGGVMPHLIQWPPAVNPVNSMQDQGIRLSKLTCITPEPEKLQQALGIIKTDIAVTILEGPTALRATVTIGDQTIEI